MNSSTADQTATGWELLTISEGEVVASVEYGDDEGTAREDYVAARADQDGHGYRLTCNGYTYAQHLEPVAVFEDDAVTVTISPGTPARSEWTITSTEHTACDGCLEQARTAAVYAVVSGSLVGSYTVDRRNLDGMLEVVHGARVARNGGTAPAPRAVVPAVTDTHGPAADHFDYLSE